MEVTPMEDWINSLFSQVEIPIINCPPELNGANVEYEDSTLQVGGVVENGKLIVEASDDIPESVTITWGRGRWIISW